MVGILCRGRLEGLGGGRGGDGDGLDGDREGNDGLGKGDWRMLLDWHGGVFWAGIFGGGEEGWGGGGEGQVGEGRMGTFLGDSERWGDVDEWEGDIVPLLLWEYADRGGI